MPFSPFRGWWQISVPCQRSGVLGGRGQKQETVRCGRQRVLCQGALRVASALLRRWKCQIQADQHFLSLPRAKAVSAVSWEALSLSTCRDSLSFSENPAQDRWVCPAVGTGAAMGLTHAGCQRRWPGKQPCSAFLECLWHK